MVEKISNELMAAIGVVERKGDPNVIAGTTECGKSTAMEATAQGDCVQKLLSIREASGKGSISEVSLIATDYESIPEDKLIMIAKLQKKTIADCGDDNELLGNIVYSGIKDYNKNPDSNLYKAKLTKTLENALKNPANESLAYKIRDISDANISKIIDIIMELPINNVKSIYDEMLVRNPKKGQQKVRTFVDLLSKFKPFEDSIQKFWECIVEIINQEIINLQNKLKKDGAVLEDFEDGSSKFTIVLGEEDLNKYEEDLNKCEEDLKENLVCILLQSEYGSKEYLFSNISLIYRGADYLYKGNESQLLTVSIQNGKEIHCVRFIDTQGLFHANGVNINDESERIIDILSKYHSNKLILLVNSFVTNTVKAGYDAVCQMLQEANRDIEIYIIYTHWDEYLKGYSHQNVTKSRFTRERIEINWKEKFEKALKDQQVVSDRFISSLASNNSRKKPCIVGFYRAAILSDMNSTMEDVLDEAKIDYPSALQNLVKDILSSEAKGGERHRVTEGIEECFSINNLKQKNHDISVLYNNLVGECKDKKLYASTVRACNRKWIDLGTFHESEVADNDNGYKNIKTLFVQEIRNYAMQYVKNNMNIDVKPYISNQDEAEDLIKELKDYLSFNQNVGRKVAKLIGEEAYNAAFIKNCEFRYQYERFNDMIQYTQHNYFMAKNIPFTKSFEKCLSEAIKACIRDFVDAKCIFVY